MRSLRALIRELSSPMGDSEAELLTDIDQVLAVLSGLCDESPPDVRIEIIAHQNDLRSASNRDDRAIATSLAKLLKYLQFNEKTIDASGLIMRLETLLRRSLPTSGVYDTPQSSLNPPYDPTKTGRYMTTTKL